jgi:hypothetical protein
MTLRVSSLCAAKLRDFQSPRLIARFNLPKILILQIREKPYFVTFYTFSHQVCCYGLKQSNLVGLHATVCLPFKKLSALLLPTVSNNSLGCKQDLYRQKTKNLTASRVPI